mgnify:CR=1 FL=1
MLSYLMSAAQTCAMQAKGVNAAIKHFVGNDQETNRTGLCTFATEQGFRQNSLKGFEGAFTKGGALGTMMSTNRIGLETMYQNAATCTGVLRDEWGFKGVTITDSVKGDKSVYAVACLVAGTDTSMPIQDVLPSCLSIWSRTRMAMCFRNSVAPIRISTTRWPSPTLSTV